MIKAPVEVYAALLEEGHYLCAPRTMHRILADSARRSASGATSCATPARHRPELVATRPNGGLVLGHHQAQGPDQVDATTTSTWCSTCSAATSWAGFWRRMKAPASPRG